MVAARPKPTDAPTRTQCGSAALLRGIETDCEEGPLRPGRCSGSQPVRNSGAKREPTPWHSNVTRWRVQIAPDDGQGRVNPATAHEKITALAAAPTSAIVRHNCGHSTVYSEQIHSRSLPMIRPLLHSIVRRFEKRYGYDATYMHEIADTSVGAFMKLGTGAGHEHPSRGRLARCAVRRAHHRGAFRRLRTVRATRRQHGAGGRRRTGDGARHRRARCGTDVERRRYSACGSPTLCWRTSRTTTARGGGACAFRGEGTGDARLFDRCNAHLSDDEARARPRTRLRAPARWR